MSMRSRAAAGLISATLQCVPVAADAVDAPAQQLEPVEVVGTTPLPGTAVPKDQVPANVQTLDAQRLRQMQGLNVPDALASRLPSVGINETQGNPFQLDVNYRGFTASPLLGVAQGLSVFLDGVRINEAFGDVVNWDLVPTGALASITLLPGSNPLFGLNTLGGALTLQTKSGDTSPGGDAEVRGGSFGRLEGSVSYGRRLGQDGHLFVYANGFQEDGWRDFSPSHLHQLFLKGGQHAAGASWDLALLHGDSRLLGNGPLPESMLAVDRRQVYTRPDETDNHLDMLTLSGTRQLGKGFELAATAYARRLRAATLNGDLNDEFDPPGNELSGVEHRTDTDSRGEGVAVQLGRHAGAHRWTLGLAYDRAHNRFRQDSAEGVLDATRAVQVTEAAATDALISGTSRTASVFAADIVSLRPNLQLTLSARYNATRVQTHDDGRTELGLDTHLDGDATYRKLNPALGLTWQVVPTLTAFGGFSQGNRAPTPIELGCSDPAQACVLPNALQGDPPLRQVVARTLEGGVRGKLGAGLRWSAAAYRTLNDDDILFVSNGRAAGYFANVGQTSRSGFELGVAQTTPLLDWSVAYSLLRAEFRSSTCLVSASNSSAQASPACSRAGEIEVQPGNRLPGLPQHSLKAALEVRPSPAWNLGAQLVAYSSQYVRGNENNAHAPDGVAFFGSGRLGGYAVVNVTGNVRLGHGWELFGKLSNVFDREYATGGLLAVNAFTPNGTLQPPAGWRHEQFVAPGAPRAVWIGARWTFDGADMP